MKIYDLKDAVSLLALGRLRSCVFEIAGTVGNGSDVSAFGFSIRIRFEGEKFDVEKNRSVGNEHDDLRADVAKGVTNKRSFVFGLLEKSLLVPR